MGHNAPKRANNVISLFDEQKIVLGLTQDSIRLMHLTRQIEAIKRLVTAHDILSMNLYIYEKFRSMDEPTWDKASLSDLDVIRRELIVYNRMDFNPAREIENWGSKVHHFIRLVSLRP